MSYFIFGIGGVLFLIYMIFLIWDLATKPKKTIKSENKIDFDDNIDYDGMGNQGRV